MQLTPHGQAQGLSRAGHAQGPSRAGHAQGSLGLEQSGRAVPDQGEPQGEGHGHFQRHMEHAHTCHSRSQYKLSRFGLWQGPLTSAVLTFGAR